MSVGEGWSNPQKSAFAVSPESVSRLLTARKKMAGSKTGHQTADKTRQRLSGESGTPLSVILALVAGIQRPDVCRVKRLFQPKDLGWLDLCDKHRYTGKTASPNWQQLNADIGQKAIDINRLLQQ
ncbi:hypothetical protein [Rhizobium sp. PL01]|uniref:hypothetical protein n=1 Tax=Rhizobium sp. PL01 TaxID=3085631 RepID=UPI0029824196|nr:hypothetical protein [Rhizobium sp. PL01]MDW5313348.1 hypothetical protein [Rhizobium sp. PL01]